MFDNTKEVSQSHINNDNKTTTLKEQENVNVINKLNLLPFDNNTKDNKLLISSRGYKELNQS